MDKMTTETPKNAPFRHPISTFLSSPENNLPFTEYQVVQNEEFGLYPLILGQAPSIAGNTRLTQIDDTVVSMTVAYGVVLGQLVQGHQLDTALSAKLMKLVKKGALPFHAVTSENLQPPHPGDPLPPRAEKFASPDALLTPSYMAAAVEDPEIRIEPAWKVSIVYGMPCAIYHQLPAAYYLAARFRDDFESALLHAINGGGQNQARAILTGALVGAEVGLSHIPPRFLDGLEESATLCQLAKDLAASVVLP